MRRFLFAALAASVLLCPCIKAESFAGTWSAAGFYPLPDTGRSVLCMNPGWKFFKGDAEGARLQDFDDSGWDEVSLPDGIELLPPEASGCINYQGPVWYRKHFIPSDGWNGKKLFLHFEAIMGKSEVWLNGHLLTEHYGGYLPVIADISGLLEFGEENVIAVRADNSDDTSYPPGKSQASLDFTYFGGIYRDCWLVVSNEVYITDPNYEDCTAGGGLFVSYDNVSDASADLNIDLHIRNSSDRAFKGKAVFELYDRQGEKVLETDRPVSLEAGSAGQFSRKVTLKDPNLWDPDRPYLYRLHVYIRDRKGDTVDGYCRRIGIRSIEFKGKDGFWLNGKPYPYPLIGANRHQDFAVIGNALPNSLHWRDAKKLRDAGLRVIRNAHYPQDPAFMDACDELGLLVIVNTPGWQFWSDEPVFAQRVYDDIRNMVRRDRNHPSVWLWEPILNETYYPDDFAMNAAGIIREEYPYPYCYAGCDATAKGHEYFPVLFTHPAAGGGGAFNASSTDPGITYFTREWGDNVDDWFSHNSPSRVRRSWGEVPMLIQARGYASTPYRLTNYDILCREGRQHAGGCLWHSFDHNRGYHPDPFYGGIMDGFRQPKFSYYMFCAQRPAEYNPELPAETGPMVFIANIMSPFSPSDVTVYSNCGQVRLHVPAKDTVLVYTRPDTLTGMPSPVITFKDVFDVMLDKKLARAGEHGKSYLLAEGLVGGKVVATHKVMPARRASKIALYVDDEGMPMTADGSDIVTVVAAVTDDNGNIKRLNDCWIHFEIEGPGTLVASEGTFTNPRKTEWGTAPVLVRAGTETGTIKVKASAVWQGQHTPVSSEIEIRVLPSRYGYVGPSSVFPAL